MNETASALMATSVDCGPKASPLRVAAALLMLAMGVGILAYAMSGDDVANRDYISYWAAGQQLVHHGNPYEAKAILPIEHGAGYKLEKPLLMRNPPFGLFLALPLGFVSVRVGAIVWSLALIASLMTSVRMLWILQGRPPGRLHLIGYVFPPALACLLAGQIGIFLLLGVTLFLYLHASRPYLAGVALLLCAMKPHLFLPFGLVLLAWIASRRAYPILVGALTALMTSTAISFVLDPGILSHYVRGERGENIQNLFIPCLSLLIRVAIHRNAIWLQFLPALAGCIWGVWYFWTRRNRWSWTDQGLLLLVVSVMVAPYAWFTDEAILLPAILAGLYRASNAGRSLLPFGGIAGIALIEVLAGVPLTSGLYIWTAPAWLAWYLFAVRNLKQSAAAELGHEACDTQVINPHGPLQKVHVEAP